MASCLTDRTSWHGRNLYWKRRVSPDGAPWWGGSFFETIPEGGDAYLLKYILHDWDDAASLAILAACRRVFRPEGRLLIMERIVGGPNDGLETKTSDLNMLVSPDGQERTADEFAALLGNAGFRMERIIEVTPRLSIVEAAPI